MKSYIGLYLYLFTPPPVNPHRGRSEWSINDVRINELYGCSCWVRLTMDARHGSLVTLCMCVLRSIHQQPYTGKHNSRRHRRRMSPQGAARPTCRTTCAKVSFYPGTISPRL